MLPVDHRPIVLASLFALITPFTHAAPDIVDTLDVHAGLEVTVFARDPEIASPTNLDVDHRGRVWVCEVINYGPRPRADGDRILILEDADGDGVADKTTVFYQGRDVDSAMGICVLGNRVIVTSSPNVLVFFDDDGDDKPDRKELIIADSGRPRYDHSLHAFTFGPDGRLYWNMGNTGYSIKDVESKPYRDIFGLPVEDRMRNRNSPYLGGMAFRANLDLTDIEVLGHNFRNNYELAVDAFGNVWQSDNDDDGHYGCRLNYLLEYGNYGYRDERTGAGWARRRVSQHPDVRLRHWHQNDPGVVPNFAQTGAGSPAGITVYEGDLLPPPFRNQVLHCDAGPGVVRAVKAEPHGAGYQGTIVNLLKGERDKQVRPVDVAVGPDGAVFVSDWYDPVLGWTRQADKKQGRIYRVAPKGHRSKAPQYDLKTAKGAAHALTSPNIDARYLGWTALHEMKDRAEPALKTLWNSDDARSRARALWLLSRLEGKGNTYIDQALADADENIRLVALRAARQSKRDLVPLIRRVAGDASPRVRAEAAIALRHVPEAQVPPLWVSLAKQYDGQDRWYLEALGIGAHHHWDACMTAWLTADPDAWKTPSGRRLVWRSRSAQTVGLVRRILLETDIDLDETLKMLRTLEFQEDGKEKDDLIRELALTSSDAPNETMIRRRTEAFLLLAAKPAAREDAEVASALDAFLKEQKGTEGFIRLVRAYELKSFFADLTEISLQPDEPELARAALVLLLDKRATEPLKEILDGNDAERIAQVVHALSGSGHELAATTLRQIMLSFKYPLSVREEAVRGMCRSSGGRALLLQLAGRGSFPSDLKAAASAGFARTIHVRHRERAAQYFPMPKLKESQPLPQMTELLGYAGNVARGKEVFKQATCAECHQVKGEGVTFGPDLSAIGDKLSKEGLYESILDPGASISPTYQGVELTLAGDRELTGYVISETDEELILRQAGGLETTVPKKDIVTRNASTVSLMPSGLQSALSLNELVDLIEYLTSLK